MKISFNTHTTDGLSFIMNYDLFFVNGSVMDQETIELFLTLHGFEIEPQTSIRRFYKKALHSLTQIENLTEELKWFSEIDPKQIKEALEKITLTSYSIENTN